ncbi:MAG: ABC transporter ATP-binding protein [Lachnospiraceae bacterium]|nr:ABC transporter ATP-binding protein [Lachnospiraceae bacterium]
MKKQTAMARMLSNVWQRDRGIYLNCAVYTVIALMMPLISVAFPKVLLGVVTSEAVGGEYSEISQGGAGILGTAGIAGAVTGFTGSVSSGERLVYICVSFLLVGGAVYFLESWLNNRCYPRICALRIDYLRDQVVKLMQIEYRHTEDSAFYEQYEMGMNACNGNNQGLEAIYHKLYELPALVVTVLVLSAIVGWRSPLVLAAIVLHIAVTVWVTVRVQKYRYAKKEELSHHSRRYGEFSRSAQDFSYGKDVRVYDLKGRVMDHYLQDVKGYLGVYKLIASREFLLGIAGLVTLLIADVTTYGVLTWLTVNGMSIADYSMYVVAAVTLTAKMTALSDNITYITNEYLYVKDFYRFMDADLGEKGGDVSAAEAGIPLEIEFDHVTFRYPGTDKTVFSDFSLHIPAGQRLAVVGVNGAGKSTLIKLLLGFFPVDSGEIRINGVNVQDYNREALYSMFAAVFQETNVIAFTVAENIAGSEEMDEEKVWQALRQVGMEEKIRALPKGIHQTMLKVIEEDGVQFSGGENQKLSIARALYKGGNCVIMDEPTAALDALAEAEVYEEFDRLTENKTAIYISHRLASTKFCDCIALLDGDGLKEYGTHSELMEKQGVYYDMFMTQSKYYREGAAE